MMNIHVSPEIQARISKQIEKYTSKTEPYVNFLNHIGEIYRAAHIPFDEKNIKTILFQNYIINAITCVEVYFKHTIVHRKNLWSDVGINKLMEARITLKDATKLLSNKDVTPAVIISHYTTFSNLESIAYNINLLTGSKIDFISAIEKQMHVHRFPENNIFEEWQSVINDIFEYRQYSNTQEKFMNDLKIIHCVRCKTDLKIPFLTKNEKKESVMLNSAKGRALAIEQLRIRTGIDLKESKALVIHMNKLGHCNRCDHMLLQGENITCPKCKSFNLNWE